jgi:hypothetical protein
MDAEVSTMNRIAKMLGELSEEERQRVVVWVARKFGAVAESPVHVTETSTASPTKVSR